MAALAGTTLTFPGSALDAMWRLNPVAHAQMAPWGALMGVPMLLLSMVLLSAAICWHRRRHWGWVLAVIVITAQIAGDSFNLLRGHVVEGAVGVVIAGMLLWWLLRSSVRQVFGSDSSANS